MISAKAVIWRHSAGLAAASRWPARPSAEANEERMSVAERMSEQSRQNELQQADTEKKVGDIDWEQFLENRTQQQALPTTRGACSLCFDNDDS